AVVACRRRASGARRRAARGGRAETRDRGRAGAPRAAHARRRGVAPADPRHVAPARTRPRARCGGAADARGGAAGVEGAPGMTSRRRALWGGAAALGLFVSFPHPVAGRVFDAGWLVAWVGAPLF